MKQFVVFFVLLFFYVQLNAQQEGDNSLILKRAWKSERDAIMSLKALSFDYIETFDPPNSAWVKRLGYYGSSESVGYLLVESKKGIYIHQEVPFTHWMAIKSANSVGGYYNFYIKNFYPLKIEGKGQIEPVN